MKRVFKVVSVVLLVFLSCAGLFAQQNVSAPQKYALIIGNSNYTGNWNKLDNPINDAVDMEAALKSLGFQVELIMNGTRSQMQTAVINFSRKLSMSRNAYGFFYYAGHGAQDRNGANYLIPVNANTQSLNQLQDEAVSVRFILDEIEEAGNELNMIVLDACRNAPKSLDRSDTRGLSPVVAPKGSIIMYATAAGKTASDGGSGRNGLFTSHLLKNLKTPGLSVMEVFMRTGSDVARSTNGDQYPETQYKYFETAYLGSRSDTINSDSYKIGDRGPAGGIVFYDKGNTSNGWRYLEVAPVSTEFRAQWGSYEKNISGTSTEIGTGKRNTQLIVDFFKTTGENGKAAQLCANLNYGGFNDWFLPSKDELNLIYKNLKNRGLGNFITTVDRINETHIYWSSSQYNSYVSWFQNFNDGYQNYASNLGKTDVFSVRAIRSF